MDIFSFLNETTNKHIIKAALANSDARGGACSLKCHSNKRFCPYGGSCGDCIYSIDFLPLLQHIKYIWAYVNMRRGICRYWNIKDNLFFVFYSLILAIPGEFFNYRLIREQVNNLDEVEIIKLAGILMDICNEVEEENNGKKENQNN